MRTRLLPAGGRALRRRHPASETGVTLVELTIVLAVVAVLAGLTTPMAASAIDASRARQAAEFVAARFRLARQQAASGSASVGVVFESADGRSRFRVCVDGSGNGVRRAEIETGQDPCPEGPYDLDVLFPGVRFAVDAALRGPDGEPGSPEAVRFGRSDIASFSPGGTCTAGSIFVRSPYGLQYAIRVAGATARTRVLRYDASVRGWREA
jgi:prepilin-type N-terminal cleavage/methylation domain-containing protein